MTSRGPRTPWPRPSWPRRKRGASRRRPFSTRLLCPGKGVTPTVDGRNVSVGSPRHAAEAGAQLGGPAEAVTRLENEGKTAVVILADGTVAGVLALRDEPRGDAAEGIAALSRIGILSVMLTGDNARNGAAIAKGLGLDVKAELLPDDKLREIGALRSSGSVADASTLLAFSLPGAICWPA